MIKVFIIDDHKLVIDGLKLILKDRSDIEVVGFAYSGLEAIKKLRLVQTDVVLLDINMPDLNGIETCKILLRQNESLKIIAVSMHDESSLIKLILANGACGYVLKNAGQEEVIRAIKTVHSGEIYLDENITEMINNSIATSQRKKDSFPTLSRREKEVLLCILDELTTQEIADKLEIGFGTVETHRRNMNIKLGVRNTAGLVRVALEYGLNK
jgi:DNA-binding NarL/FixJ family response regulator